MSDNKVNNNPYLGSLICIIVGFVLGFIIGYKLAPTKIKEVEIPTPVEKKVTDTLYLHRDTIIYKTKYITKIQHDTIEKVYNLNDSSTIDLFYKLVSE